MAMTVGTEVVVKDYPSGTDRPMLIGRHGKVVSNRLRFIEVAIDGDTIKTRLFDEATELKEVPEQLKPLPIVDVVVYVDKKVAQQAAVELGKKWRFISLNDVYDSLAKKYNKTVDQIDVQTNSVFTGADWQNTGKTIRSKRPQSRRRKISVWEYITKVKVVSPKFQVQVCSNGMYWHPSKNLGADKLFNDKQTAENAANTQSRIMGSNYRYRVIQVN